jgi:ATP-dependent RNA helicase SUPV3L1/SUV3
VLWRDEEIARLEPGEDPLKPQIVLLADDNLTGPDKERVQQRLDTWIGEIIGERLKSLIELSSAEDLSGMARGIAFRLKEGFGILERQTVADDVRALDQAARAQLRKYGVRFGAFNIYLPLLLKPAAGELRLVLWALKHAGEHGLALDALPEPPKAGRTSVAADATLPPAFYRATGYHLCGERAVRTDILERLADQIRPLIAWKPATGGGGARPKGATGDGGFVIVPEMLSILGCSAEELGGVLRALGFHVDRRPAPKTMIDPAPVTPVVQAEAVPEATGSDAEASSEAEVAVAADDMAVASEEIAAPAEPAPALVEAVVAEVPAESAESASPPSEPVEADSAPAAEISAEAAADTPNADATEVAAEAEAVAEPAADAAAPASPTEPVLIEIWRPRRRHRGEQRTVDGRPERQGGRHRRQGRDSGRRPDQAGTPAPSAPAAQAGGETAASEGQREERRESGGGGQHRHQRGGGAPQQRPRDGEPREGKSEQQQRGPRENRDNRERRHGGNKGAGGEGRREDRRDDRRPQRDDRQQGYMRSAAPPKRTAVDPDSPFAALSALKLQLEKRGNETGSS